MKKILTLSIITKDDKILLGMKKRGFGMGKWNGFGGKVQTDESIVESLRREIFEEVSLVVDEAEEVGVLSFTFEGDELIHEVHLFKITEFSGEPEESEEMRPMWYKLEDIPYSEMWIDDQIWLPRILGGERLKGWFQFSKDGSINVYKLENI